ncbi:MAG: TetR/AcrR family transcriptional regulator [Candidatus Hydrogenedentes bacterium]|nr:TetR/AcrR family transcriptional regulator [Candidatus Hydrogenedentota bacterium]
MARVVAHADGAPNAAEVKLLESALQHFADKGYAGTSIREIIEGAGVTRPVLYYYFENKEDLFRRLVEMKFAEYVGQVREVFERVADTRDRLRAIMAAAFRMAEEQLQVVQLILQVFFSPPAQGPPLDRNRLGRKRFKLIEETMREGLDRRELSGGDAQSLALVFIGIMEMHIMAKSDRPDIHLTPDLAFGLVDLFLAGAKYSETPATQLTSLYSTAR